MASLLTDIFGAEDIMSDIKKENCKISDFIQIQ